MDLVRIARTSIAALCAALVTALLIAGCSSKPKVQTYKLEGTVVAIDKNHHSVMVDSKAIPDYMEAMTMAYDLPNDASLNSLKTGDHIEATLQVTGDKSWLENVRTTSSAQPNK